jgi:tRNA 2-thiouridine synthesizing protein E
MPTKIFTDVTVDVNDEGFFTKPAEWTEDMVPEIAASEGVDHLTEDHLQVIRFMRSRYLNKDHPPTCRVVSKHCGVSVRQLYSLFPRRPIKIAAKIAGVPEPRAYLGGCGINWKSAWR